VLQSEIFSANFNNSGLLIVRLREGAQSGFSFHFCLMREQRLWSFILSKLMNDEAVMLMCVTESAGSSPGRQGFKMAVAKDGMFGSIGGGMMEHKFVELSKELLDESNPPLLRKQFHQKSAPADRSGMICSGEQTILLYRLTNNNIDVIQSIADSMMQNKNGRLKITPSEIYFSKGDVPLKDFSFEMKSETEFEYMESTGLKNHLYLIGGGHCALALSRLMNSLDFYIHLFEDRAGLNTVTENYFIHEKKIVQDYSALSELIPSGEHNYVVVMTFGYRTDYAAVRALAGGSFRYVGVLGSESKMKELFAEWRKEGVPENFLNNIYSPIGLQINSETPEEIAVSIAAQIIKVKNSQGPVIF
jgi:xanthine dehydrogenase accessory factor